MPRLLRSHESVELAPASSIPGERRLDHRQGVFPRTRAREGRSFVLVATKQAAARPVGETLRGVPIQLLLRRHSHVDGSHAGEVGGQTVDIFSAQVVSDVWEIAVYSSRYVARSSA